MGSAKLLLDRIDVLATRMAEEALSSEDSAIAYAAIKVLVSDLDALNEEEYDEDDMIDERLGEVEDHAAFLAGLDEDGNSLQQHCNWLMAATAALRAEEYFDVEGEEE
jgi:hypothetical protein